MGRKKTDNTLTSPEDELGRDVMREDRYLVHPQKRWAQYQTPPVAFREGLAIQRFHRARQGIYLCLLELSLPGFIAFAAGHQNTSRICRQGLLHHSFRFLLYMRYMRPFY